MWRRRRRTGRCGGMEKEKHHANYNCQKLMSQKHFFLFSWVFVAQRLALTINSLLKADTNRRISIFYAMEFPPVTLCFNVKQAVKSMYFSVTWWCRFYFLIQFIMLRTTFVATCDGFENVKWRKRRKAVWLLMTSTGDLTCVCLVPLRCRL